MGFPNVYGKMLLTFYGKPFWWSHFAQTMQIENSNSEIEQKWLFRPTFSMHVKKRKKNRKAKPEKLMKMEEKASSKANDTDSMQSERRTAQKTLLKCLWKMEMRYEKRRKKGEQLEKQQQWKRVNSRKRR